MGRILTTAILPNSTERPQAISGIPTKTDRNDIMKNTTLRTIAALAFATFAGSACAAEISASFDPAKCKVDYPKASLMNEEQGTTSMSFLVNADGSVADSKLDKSSGFKGLDKAAQKGLSACKFKPGTKDGAPAQTWAKVDYAWKLD
jgi:protein TonB